MEMGVVADDVTGANDIGIMYARAGYETHVYAWDGHVAWADPRPDVAILDTNSRFDAPADAYAKVAAATRALMDAGCARFFKKTCSVFRGNIGSEFDAMLDTLGEDFAIVVAGYPGNGRTTVHGIHYVFDGLLENSHFRQDPVHPMTRSRILDILQDQTRRRVGHVDAAVLDEGSNALRARIATLKGQVQYALMDVRNQDDLRTIAEATRDERIFCGSAGLAEEMPGVWGAAPDHARALGVPPRPGLGILCAAGSLTPVTAGQITYLRETCGIACFALNPLPLFDPAGREREVSRLTDLVAGRLRAAEDVLLHTANAPAEVEAAKAEGRRRGMTDAETGRVISDAIGRITADATRRAGQNRLLVAGGDTSAAVCARLGIRAHRIWKQVQTGLPSCVALTDPPALLVLKAGSMGTPDFMAHALRHLRDEV